MAEHLALLFTLAPVARGFFAMVLSGAFFPLCGVMVLRLDLIPMRYMLMHGVILGGALSLAMNLPVVPVSVAVNLILIFGMIYFSGISGGERTVSYKGAAGSNGEAAGMEGRKKGRGIIRIRKNAGGNSMNFGATSAGAMVLSMALASIIMHVKDVPAKDSLSLMWGSPFTLSFSDVVLLSFLCLLLLFYVIFNFKTILWLFFNEEVAFSAGVKTRFHKTLMVMIVALVVAVGMKLLGAFLIDSLLILPVLTGAALKDRTGSGSGIKGLMILSCMAGVLFAVSGYVLAVLIDWPPAAAISLTAGVVFCVSSVFKIQN